MRPRSSSEQSVTHSEQRKDGRGQNPASQANLKPFEKGYSGNPGGKYKKSLEFVDALIEHGKNGLVADVEDAGGLASGLLQLAENPTLRQRVATAALETGRSLAYSVIARRYRKEVYDHAFE